MRVGGCTAAIAAVLLWSADRAVAQISTTAPALKASPTLDLHDPALSVGEVAAVLPGRLEGRTLVERRTGI